MSPFPRRALRTAGVATAIAAVTVASVAVAAPTAQAESLTLTARSKLVITLRGNGHGHGMSQYGAYGAAQKGLSYAKILAFYYPGTTLTTLPRSSIKVRVGSLSSPLTVTTDPTLTVTGLGTLPRTGVSRYRLTPARAGFTLQQLRSKAGSTWRTYRTGLADRAEFWRADGHSLLAYRSGGSGRYYGALRAVRSGAGAYVVNRVSLDSYTAGVVPSEMPTSWRAQAVNAQAVAARTYGRYAVEHPSNREYDICDTTQCQVYNARTQYDGSGRVVSSDYRAAAAATANKVLRYKGKTIFAQFAASNGGWSSDGGQPYLRAKADPYDSGQTSNPYIDYRRTVTASSLASYFGLAKLTRLAITGRDGHGAWGGRVTAATLTGTTSAGKAKRVDVSGSQLQWGLGVGTTLFTVRRG